MRITLFKGAALAATVTAAALTLTGCGVTIPTDPNGTLEQVREGILKVGVSPNDVWTDFNAGDPTGVDVELVTGFATELGADVEWEFGGEEALIGELERGELDLVIGGLTDTSPWADKAAITKPFVEATGADGSPEKHVMAAPLGENDFLLELETFLLNQEVEVP